MLLPNPQVLFWSWSSWFVRSGELGQRKKGRTEEKVVG